MKANENDKEMEQTKRANEEDPNELSLKSKKIKLFSAKEFRKKLNSASERQTALLQFLHLCSESQAEIVIQEYLEKGGSCLELLQLLEVDSQSPHCVILNIVNYVLLQIIANHPKHHQQTLEACRFLLNTKLPLINKMLSFASTSEERKTILRLLTAFVTLSASLSREILQHVHFNPGNLELLTKQTGKKGDVRSHFIKFMVAFLLEGHFPTISLLLEKKGVLSNVVKGLLYDEADIVCIILTALKNHVLENPLVSKTMKMKLFSTPIVKEIVNLYNWKGPENFNPNLKKKKFVEINEYEKSKVSESVHGFLLTLCTSHRFGIIFSDHMVGLGRTGSNNLIFSVLDSLENPWEHSYARELVLKICKSCPDLVKTVWSKLKDTIEPRDSDRWKKSITFATDLIKELDPTCVEYCFSELSTTQRTQVVQMLAAPASILKAIIPEDNEFGSKSIKYYVYVFLVNSLQRILSYNTFVQKRCHDKEYAEFKNSLGNYIFRNFPAIQTLLKDWNKEFDKSENETKDAQDLELLTLSLQILELYEEVCLQQFEMLAQDPNIELQAFIDNLYKYLETIKDQGAADIQILEIKLVNIFLKFDQSLFRPSGKLFSTVFPSVIKHYRITKDKITYNTLRSLLILSDIFDDVNFEINIWIDSIFYGDEFDDSVSTFLMESLKITEENLSLYLEERTSYEINTNLYDKGDLYEILTNLNAEINRAIRLRYKKFSVLLLGSLNYLLNDSSVLSSVKYYLNYLLVNLLHSQAMSETFLNVILSEKFRPVIPKVTLKYCQSWKNETEGKLSQKVDGPLKVLRTFWQTENEDITQILKSNAYPNLKLFMLQMCVFHIINLTKFGLLTSNHINKILQFVKIITEDSYEEDELKQMLCIIFENPMILHYFLPSYSTKNSVDMLCKQFVTRTIEIIKNSMELRTPLKNNLEEMLKPFRHKLITFIGAVLRKPKKIKIKDNENLVEILKIFGLNCNDSTLVLSHCLNVEKDNLVSSGSTTCLYDILVFSLECFNEDSENRRSLVPLDSNIVQLLSEHLVYLNKNESNCDTSKLASAIRRYFVRFPHSLEYISTDLFESIIGRVDQCNENSLLAANILKCNKDYLNTLKSNISSIGTKKGLILPLLEAAIQQNAEEDLLKSIYDQIEPYIFKCLEKPQKAGQHFNLYINSITLLLSKFMSTETYSTYFEKIKKFNTTEPFHVILLSSIMKKTLLEKSVSSGQTRNYIMTIVYLLTAFIRNKELSEENWAKLEEMIKHFNSIISEFVKNDLQLTDISGNETFKFYCKFCLKHGISGNSVLLNNLNALLSLNIFNESDSSIILEMTLSHSEFLNAALGETEVLKEEILNLIFIICGRYHQLIHKNHMPILLAAYCGTLRKSDKIIFSLLKLYEERADQTDFYSFKPFLFGPAAATHYSVRQNIQNVLWRQPKVGDVLDLLEDSIVTNTIKHFPLHNSLDHVSEHNSVSTSVDVYDLSFMLPLFGSLLAPENAVPTYKFTKKGALSLTVLALSSFDEGVRMAACHVLYRFHNHLEGKPESKDKVLWLRFVEAICKGASVLEDTKLNSFSAIFWARMALILTLPTHPLYLSMSSYLASKLSPDLSGIPELYTWLHDSSVSVKEHQHFILEILRDGIRTKEDFDVALRSVAFKLIMELFSSCVSNQNIRLGVLEVLESACKIPYAVNMLVNNYGLVSWLYGIATKLTPDNISYLDCLLKILANISEHLGVEGDKTEGTLIVNLILISLIDSNLLTYMKGKNLTCFLDLLYKCLSEKSKFLSEIHVRKIISHVNDDVCEYLLRYGKRFFVIQNYQSDEVTSCARNLILKWIDIR